MFSVVITEVIQFCILSVSSIVLGIIAMRRVSPEMLQRVIPPGWDNPFFGWRLDLEWTPLIPSVQDKIAADGYSLFTIFFMMLLLKGILVSAAGPAPNYDMQRILSTRNPREASLMNMWVNVVLIFPRYFLITGLTILALVFYSDTIRSMGGGIDFEMVLPYALDRFVPVGLRGLLVACEVAMSLVLLVGAALLLRSFVAVMGAERGFETENRLVFEVTLPPSYDDEDGVRASRARTDLLARIGALEPVRSAAAINVRPLVGLSVGMGFAAPDQSRPAGEAVPWATAVMTGGAGV